MRISDWSSDVCSSDLVAFYAPVVVVGGIAFLVVDAYAVNAAVALIEHREVVAKTICKGNAARREGAGAILQAGAALRVLCPGVDRSKRRRQQHRAGRGCQGISIEHHPRKLPIMRPAVAGPWLFPVRQIGRAHV